MERKLKPCPFCGSERVATEVKQSGYMRKKLYVQCKVCNARTGVILTEPYEQVDPLIEMVQEMWNDRKGG